MNIALFDFDGTITKKDSFYDFIGFVGKKHKSKGDSIAVVTASIDSWISSWCKEYGIDLISFDINPPPPVEDPDRFYRSGEK